MIENKIYKILNKYGKLRGTPNKPLFSDRLCVEEILKEKEKVGE